MDKIVEITDQIKQEDENAVLNGLIQYNLQYLEDKNPRDLGLYIRDEEHHVIAGLIGHTHGNWLMVKYLWVSSELRGQRVGSQLLGQAEAEAIKRNCKYVFLDTFSFQAPAFYEKKGYQQQMVLEHYPVTGKRYYYTKQLV